VIAKEAEYLEAGVKVVGVLDPDSQTLHLYRPGAKPDRLEIDQELELSDLLPGFRVPVRQLFE